uniref:Reverse transcriptase domain-containing protein n=1 Tax=Oryzias sinensis TaxID=183150 RepID=A0A8C8E3R6_9TELE
MTQIDLIFINRPERIAKSFNMLTGLSDHNLTLLSRKLTEKRFHSCAGVKEIITIPKNKYQNFVDEANQIQWDNILPSVDTENDGKLFLKTLKRTITEFTQKIKQKPYKNTVPWMNSDIIKLMKEQDQALKKANKTKLTHDRGLFAILRNKVVRSLRKAKADFFLTIIEKSHGNSKIIWNQIRKMTGDRPKEQNILEIKINRQLTNNVQVIAEAFSNYFIDSVANIARCFTPVETYNLSIDASQPTFSFTNITESDVSQTINLLKPSRCKDIFGLDTVMLKDLCSSLTRPITKIINLSLSQKTFPSTWKPAIVSPIFKSGDLHSMSNYRPISILPAVSKIAEKLVAKQIINHLDTTLYSLHPMQFGFRANYSTETATCFFTENIRILPDRGGVVGAVFLDLKKAFDTVNHKILLSKLCKFNFSSDALQWIDSYLTDRSQLVKVQSFKSAALSLPTGIPQGSILGPLLFSLYINDLPSSCPDVSVQMYADDTVVYAHGSNSSQVAEKLTNAMVNITAWLKYSCLQLNTSKTVAMFFTKSDNNLTAEPDVFVSGERLQIVSEYKYLGVLLDSKLSFKSHIKRVCNRIKFNLSNFRHIRHQMSTQSAKMYMHSMIFSHITYCLSVWSQACNTSLKPVQTLYKQTVKTLDKKPNIFHHCTILQKHGLLSWENMVKFSNLCLMYKILHGLSSPPLHQFINIRTADHSRTRSAVKGDCIIPFRKSVFGQTAFSVRAATEWNFTLVSIRNQNTYHLFKTQLKKCLIDNQSCQH